MLELERDDAAALIRALDALIEQDSDTPPESALRKLQTALITALGGVRPGPPQVPPEAQTVDSATTRGEENDN